MIPPWLRDYVTGRLAAAGARVRTIAVAGRRLVELAGDAGAESDQRQALYLQHYGFRSHPPQGSEAVSVPVLGNARQPVVVATECPGTGPRDQAEGETEIYSRGGARVQCRANGDVQLNAGTKPIGRQDDPVWSGALTLTVAGVAPAAQTLTLTYTDQDGATTPLLTATITAGLVAILDPLTTAQVPTQTRVAPVNGRIAAGAPRSLA